MSGGRGTFDFILDTIPVGHDVNPYLNLLAPNGNMVLVGAIEPLPPVHGGLLAMRNRTLAGSLIGGLPGDSGNARLLRRAWHPSGDRDDPDSRSMKPTTGWSRATSATASSSTWRQATPAAA